MPLVRLYKYLMDGRDEMDEKMGMTEKQKKLVQNTWAIVRKDEVSAIRTVLFTLFTRYPEYQNEFKQFKGMSFDELSKSKRFEAHCANAGRALSGVFDYIHDPELIEASLLSLAEKHKTRGQTLQQFQNVRLVFEDIFPSVFGKQYTPEVQEAWKKMFDYIFPILYRPYND